MDLPDGEPSDLLPVPGQPAASTPDAPKRVKKKPRVCITVATVCRGLYVL